MSDSPETPSGWRQIDHTADLALELWAPTEAELLAIGAQAVIAILTDSAAISSDQSRTIEIDAVDAEDRFVQWLNEVIVAAVVDGFLIQDAEIQLGNGCLSATAHGQANAHEQIVTELKSATYHDLLLEHRSEGSQAQVTARVVIDV